MQTIEENPRLAELRDELQRSFQNIIKYSLRPFCVKETNELRSLRRAYNGLKRQYEDLLRQGPTNDPLLCLPPEIWITCLMEATSGQIGGLIPLMTVSQLWMQKISGSSSLWSKVYIDASESSEQVLEYSCIFSAGLPLELVVYWPLSNLDPVWSKLQLATPRCTRLVVDVADGVNDHSSGRRKFVSLFETFSWPVLVHLEISPQFGAKAWDRLHVMASTSLRSVRGLSKEILISSIGCKCPSSHKDLSWKGDQVTVARVHCNVKIFTAVSSESLQTYDANALPDDLDLRPRGRKQGAGPPRPFPSLSYLPTYIHVSSLHLHEKIPRWWFQIRYHQLRAVHFAIDALQVADAIKLLSSSIGISSVKLTILTDGEPPQDASPIPQLSELATLHLEIGSRGAHSQGDLISTTQNLSKWLVELFKRFLRTSPPIRRLTFRAVGVPIDVPTSADFILALNNLELLQDLTLPTILSFQTPETSRIRLPNLKYLVTKDERILSYLDVFRPLVVETISVRGQQRVVEFPSNYSNTSSIHMLRYGMNCLLGKSWGGIFESLQIVEFMKQDTMHDGIWYSSKVDEFCEILVDNAICPQLHTIGSSLFMSWDGLFRLIVVRNFLTKHRSSANIKCIRLSRLPHPRFLVPLATLLRGMFPPHADGDVHTITAYRDETGPGCFNCLAGGWACDSPAVPLGVEEDPILTEMPYLECHGPLHELIFGSQDLWMAHRAKLTMCRDATMKRIGRVSTCSRHHTAGKWAPLIDITSETLWEETTILAQESEKGTGDSTNMIFLALFLVLVLLSQ